MYQPESYVITLAFMILSMLCWGSWANTTKLRSGCRFQLIYLEARAQPCSPPHGASSYGMNSPRPRRRPSGSWLGCSRSSSAAWE